MLFFISLQRIPSILMKDVREKVLKATVKLEAPDANVYSVSAIQQGSDEIYHVSYV
jgi:hypothetical protein